MDQRFSSAVLRKFGITRVGDVTGLDTIGIPVWFACRPNSRSLSVSQGKGITDCQAQISAVMEAIECAAAEAPKPQISVLGSVDELRERGLRLVPFECLARTQANLIDGTVKRAWVRGEAFSTLETVYAPFELIGMDMRSDFPWDRKAFCMSSQGLAAGFDFDAAVLHALLELVEHDASFALEAAQGAIGHASNIRYQAGLNADLDFLIGKLADAGIVPELYDITNSIGIPVVMAVIPREVLSPDGPILRRSAGIACRLDMCTAAIAAILEAVQSRLTDISGARDDLPEERYQQNAQHAANRTAQWVDLSSNRVPVAGRPGEPIWKGVAAHVLARGVNEIFVFALDTGVEGFSVVRVLGSGLSAATGMLDEMSFSSLNSFLGEGVN